MYELDPETHDRVRPPLQGMEHNLIMATVLEGTSPGRVWADHATNPRTIPMASPEGHFVAGAQPDAAVARSLRELMLGEILPRGRAAGWTAFCLHYPRSGWEDVMGSILEGRSPVRGYQQHLVLEELKVGRREGLPGTCRCGVSARNCSAGTTWPTSVT